VLLIEEAPALRCGGYVIDFWGVGYDVAEKMGSGCVRFASSTSVAAEPAVSRPTCLAA
jgi:hypothetical protein